MNSRCRNLGEKFKQKSDGENTTKCSGKRSPKSKHNKLNRGLRCCAAESPSNSFSSILPDETVSQKTPNRPSTTNPLSSYGSPCNDTEVQQEIFWDPTSPTVYKLGQGKKRIIGNGRFVEISEIVNRINPREEKPAGSEQPLLKMWIGDDAIPSTPGILKIRTRSKINGIGFQRRNTEEELMKLAKQFDRNFVEQDICQEEEIQIEEFGHVNIDIGHLVDSKEAADNLDDHKDKFPQLQNLQSVVERTNETEILSLSFRSVPSSIELLPQRGSQLSLDLEAEDSINALFDGSTQHLTGSLSPASSGPTSSVIPSGENLNKRRTPVCAAVQSSAVCAAVQSSASQKTSGPKTEDSSVLQIQQKSLTALLKEGTAQAIKVQFTNHESRESLKTESGSQCAATCIPTDDFDDDWCNDDMLEDSFVMLITQNPEIVVNPRHSAKPPSVMSTSKLTSKKTDETREHDCKQNGSGTTLPPLANHFQASDKKLHGSGLSCSADAIHSRIASDHTNLNQVSHLQTGNGLGQRTMVAAFSDTRKYAASVASVKSSAICVDKVKHDVIFQEGSHHCLTSHNLLSVHHEKCKHNNSAFQKLPSREHLGDSKPVSKSQKGSETGKLSSACTDNWNDSLFCDQAMSDSIWDANDEDDDALYQLCDDVEKLTQSQNKNSEESSTKTTCVVSVKSKFSSALPKQEQQGNRAVLQSYAEKPCAFSKVTDSCTTAQSALSESALSSGKNISASLSAIANKMLVQNCNRDSRSLLQRPLGKNINNASVTFSRSHSLPSGSLNLKNHMNDISKSCQAVSNQDVKNLQSGALPAFNSDSVLYDSQSGFHLNRTSNTASKFRFTKIKGIVPNLYNGSNQVMGAISESESDPQICSETVIQSSITFCGKTQTDRQMPLKRQFSDSVVHSVRAFPTTQADKRCSVEEIERKKQEALARRKMRMQAVINKNATPP